MTTRRTTITLLTAVTMGAAALALTGCSGLSIPPQSHEEHFDTRAEASEGWVGVEMPSWIPADATDIHNRATPNEISSMIRVTSAEKPAGECVQAERTGIPYDSTDWSTQTWPDTVTVCGSYEIMPMDGGWLGWFQGKAEGDLPKN